MKTNLSSGAENGGRSSETLIKKTIKFVARRLA